MTSNGIVAAGVAPGAGIVAVKVLDAGNPSARATSSPASTGSTRRLGRGSSNMSLGPSPLSRHMRQRRRRHPLARQRDQPAPFERRRLVRVLGQQRVGDCDGGSGVHRECALGRRRHGSNIGPSRTASVATRRRPPTRSPVSRTRAERPTCSPPALRSRPTISEAEPRRSSGRARPLPTRPAARPISSRPRTLSIPPRSKQCSNRPDIRSSMRRS